MNWLRPLLVLAGLQTTAWSASLLTFSLQFPSEELEVGATVSFNLSGQFTVNNPSTHIDYPDRFTAHTPIYEGSVVYAQSFVCVWKATASPVASR